MKGRGSVMIRSRETPLTRYGTHTPEAHPGPPLGRCCSHHPVTPSGASHRWGCALEARHCSSEPSHTSPHVSSWGTPHTQTTRGVRGRPASGRGGGPGLVWQPQPHAGQPYPQRTRAPARWPRPLCHSTLLGIAPGVALAGRTSRAPLRCSAPSASSIWTLRVPGLPNARDTRGSEPCDVCDHLPKLRKSLEVSSGVLCPNNAVQTIPSQPKTPAAPRLPPFLPRCCAPRARVSSAKVQGSRDAENVVVSKTPIITEQMLRLNIGL